MSDRVSEEYIRARVQEIIKRESLSSPRQHLYEVNYAVKMMPSDWHAIFVEPWANFLKGVKIEAKKFAASALLSVRLLFTLNQKRAQEMIARHKDRMKEFNKQSTEIFEKLGGDAALNDMNLLLFLANPGGWALKKMAGTTADAASGTWEFAKEIGIGDKSIATVKGDESEEDALIRRRDQRGPIAKALGALEQIFLFAGHQTPGHLLIEGSEGVLTDDINAEIMAGPMGSLISQTRTALEQSINEFNDLVKNIAAQNSFLAGIGSPEMLQNLVTMRSSVNEFARLNPKAAEELNGLLDSLQSDADRLASDEKFVESLAEKHGATDENSNILTPVLIRQEALTAVTGEVFERQYSQFIELIQQNNELLQTTFDEMFPEGTLTDEVVAALNSVMPGFKKSISTAERILEKELRF